MAQIKNIEGLTVDEINRELSNGAKFVVFEYCVSIVVMTFKRGSNIHFIKAGQSTVKYSIGLTLLTLVFGWWGIPWGPIYTFGAIFTNLGGGTDVTQDVLRAMNSNNYN
jgi:hypothetical protein